MSRSKVNKLDSDRWSRKRAVIAKFQEMDNSRTELRGRPNRIARKYGRF